MSTTTANKGLGRGLSALMGEDYSQTVSPEQKSQKTSSTSSNTLPLEAIHSGKFQPRTKFTEEYLNELADSIEKNGVMQPIIVRPSKGQNGKYEIIAGERRWRASKLAKLTEIPAIIREIDDDLALELALVENIQRQDLTPLEEAAGYQRLIEEFNYTQEQLAQTIGKSRSHISNLLRLLSLPDKIKTYLNNDELSMGHARALLTVEHPIILADQVVREGLNVRQTEDLVRGGSPNPPKPDSRPKASKPRNTADTAEKDDDIIALEETLSNNMGLKVSINTRSGQSGEVVIQYDSLGQLDEILRRLGDSI